MRVFPEIYMDFLQLPNYFLFRKIQDCSESVMFSRIAKCLENDPTVSEIVNFYKIRDPFFSQNPRKPTPVVESCFF